MTDRHVAYTVTLVKPIREDDAQRIIEAIQMVKGVRSVVPVVADVNTHLAFERAYDIVKRKVFEALEPQLAAHLEDEDR